MTRIRTSGPLSLRISGLLALNRIALATYARRAIGRGIPGTDTNLEIGIRFWRHQFTRAMTAGDIARGRLILDSVQTETDDVYEVETEDTPLGRWYRPRKRTCPATLLYFHGGGYAFHGRMSLRFAAMLSHQTGAPLYAPDYRLTPEHLHPAQAEDALTAWHRLGSDPAQTVVIGDSAGGHMALMLLQGLKAQGLPQPGLCIGLCPWTDIGARGASLHQSDATDLVQGWQALQFGAWLDPAGLNRKALSPIFHDYAGLAPIYLQAGGLEILRDMIRDFARIQKQNGADVTLDEWSHMPHDFQLMDSTQTDAQDALARIAAAIRARVA